jgi:uridine phosphorylase
MPPADKPHTDGLQYHTRTRPGDLAPLCLIVGAPGRATMIAREFLENTRDFSNPERGLMSYTGEFRGVPVSVTTSGMGGPSMGIVLPEAVRSGARIFIRVGSCGSLIRESKVGDVIIPTAAIRFDATADDWAPKEYPAFASWHVVSALHRAASAIAPGRFHSGVECTTSDFYGGQGRPNLFNTVSERMQRRHEEVMRLGAACYSMETSALFVWCATEGGGLPAGAVHAVFGNRHTNQWDVAGEELAAKIGLEALLMLHNEEALAPYLTRRQPVYPEAE